MKMLTHSETSSLSLMNSKKIESKTLKIQDQKFEEIEYEKNCDSSLASWKEIERLLLQLRDQVEHLW
jgi:hypothetical protein